MDNGSPEQWKIGLFFGGGVFLVFRDRLKSIERKSKKERQKKSRGTMKQSKGKTIKADACSTASVDLYQIPQIESNVPRTVAL